MMDDLKKYSVEIGEDPYQVQGAGGNVSWKDGDTLWIKASGTWLLDAVRKDIFVPLDFEHLRSCVRSDDYSAIPVVKGNSTLKPSIETFLHAVMPHPVVVHTHPVDVLAHVVKKEGFQSLKKCLGDTVSWGWVDYVKPGEALASAVSDLQRTQKTDVVFLANHGVVVGGDDVKRVRCTYERILKALSFPKDKDQTSSIQSLACDPHHLALLNRFWAMYPDHVVFLGASAPVFSDTTAWKNAVDENGNNFNYGIIPGDSVVMSESVSMNQRAMMQCYVHVLNRLGQNDDIRCLTSKETEELLAWDCEKYRRMHQK